MTAQDIKPWYKQSSLWLIPENWEIKNLWEVCELITKWTTPPTFADSGINFIKTEAFTGETIDKNELSFIDETTHNTILKRSILKENDILFTIAWATIWKIAIVTKDLLPANTNQALAIIRLNKNINTKYIKFVLESNYMKKYIKQCVKWWGQPNLNLQQLNDFIIPISSFQEQEEIVKTLWKVDENIEKTQNMIENLELRNKWLIQQLLSWKHRLKWFNTPVKLSVLWTHLKEISIKNKDNKIKTVLSVTNSRWFINQDEQFEREIASSDKTNYKIIKKWQFAYNPSRVNVWSIDLLRSFDIWILSPMYVVFETKQEKLLPEFVYYHLKSHWFYGHIPMYVQWSVRDSLWFDWLSEMKFFIPDVEEQNEIVKILDKATEQVNLYKQKLEKLQELKKWLMQQLLTWKVRVKEFRN